MAEIKVLALDLDGTLTNDQKEVTPRTRAALDAAMPLWEGAQRELEGFLGEEDAQAVLRIGARLQELV